MDNRSFWDHSARYYDTFMKYFSPNYNELAQRIAHDTQNAQRVLEVATGTGLITLDLARSQRQVTGLDFAPAMVAQAQQKAQAEKLDNVHFIVGSAYQLPGPNGHYDAVICANALHVMDQPRRAIQEMKRILKKGGKLIVPTYCHSESIKAKAVSHLMHLFGFKAYTRFTTESFQYFIQSYGFAIETVDKSDETIPLCYLVAINT